jgi:hypothetical protein
VTIDKGVVTRKNRPALSMYAVLPRVALSRLELVKTKSSATNGVTYLADQVI